MPLTSLVPNQQGRTGAILRSPPILTPRPGEEPELSRWRLWARAVRRSPFIPLGLYCQLRYFFDRQRWGGGEPTTYLQKIKWRIAFDRRPLLALLVDKVRVREFIIERVGLKYLPVCFDVLDSEEQIDPSRLPSEFVIKPNHGCGMVWFVTDRAPARALSRDPFRPVFCSKSGLDLPALQKRCREWLAIDYSRVNFEWAYKNIPRRLLIEEYLSGANGTPAADYKFIVIRGNVHAIQVDSQRFGEHRRSYYSTRWELLPVSYVRPTLVDELPAPAALAEMITVAEALGRNIDHVRVDMYCLANRVVVGELTIYHNAGCSAYDPESFDIELGQAWELPSAQAPQAG